MFKAFRTIPVMLDIARDIAELCPDAWLINFTNPSGMVTEAMFRYSPLKKVVGLCNVPIHLERSVARQMKVEPERVKILFAGLNHMVFGLSVTLDGEVVTNRLIEDIISGNRIEQVKNISDVDYCHEFYRSLGVLMCPYHNYYFKKDRMLADELLKFKEGKTRASEVAQIESELFDAYRDENLDVKPKALESRGGAYYSDAACRLMESICLDKRDIQPVDTENNGTISGIDDDSVVEVSSVITKNGPVPLRVGKLPTAINGLVQQMKTFERLTVEAAVDGDYGKAILALTLNPLTPSDDVAKRVVDDLLQAHQQYLPKMFGNKNKIRGNSPQI
jgi:6-phospho-beta-glucosidase